MDCLESQDIHGSLSSLEPRSLGLVGWVVPRITFAIIWVSKSNINLVLANLLSTEPK